MDFIPVREDVNIVKVYKPIGMTCGELIDRYRREHLKNNEKNAEFSFIRNES